MERDLQQLNEQNKLALRAERVSECRNSGLSVLAWCKENGVCSQTWEERYTKRVEQAKPVLDALLAWANEIIGKTAPKSALGKALHYLLEQWPYLVRYSGTEQQPC